MQQSNRHTKQEEEANAAIQQAYCVRGCRKCHVLEAHPWLDWSDFDLDTDEHAQRAVTPGDGAKQLGILFGRAAHHLAHCRDELVRNTRVSEQPVLVRG